MLTPAACLLPVLLLAAAPGTPDTLPPREALARYADARLLEQRGAIAEALVEYARVFELDPRAISAARHASDLAARAGDPQQSLTWANRALAVDSTDARSRWLAGSALAVLGRNGEALAALERAADADEDDVEIQKSLARVAEQLDRVDVVARAWRRAAELDGDDGESWFQLAAAEVRLGHFTAADSALDEAQDLVPDRPGMLFLRGWVRESTGRPGEAVALYRQHLVTHPSDHFTRQRLMLLLARTQRWNEALVEARRLVRDAPNDADALEANADFAFRAGHADEGRRMLSRLTALSPDDPALASRAAGVLGRVGKPAEAVRGARAWAAAHPGDAHGPTLVAGVLAATGSPDSAIAEGRRAVTMSPDSIGPRVLLARVLQSQRRFREAAAEWGEAFRRHPDQARLGLDYGLCLELAGDVEGAVSAGRDVLKVAPDDPAALNFLGYLFADHNRDLREAERLVKRALEREPDNGSFIDSMGWVEYRLGRLPEARHHLEEAVRLTGGDPVVREHLGDVYRDLHLADLAREQYREASAADSSNARLKTKLEEVR